MAKSRNVIPQGEIIAKFDNYEAAVGYVEKLVEGNFPAGQIAVVGRGVRTVERIRGKVTYARLALNGFINGALIGAVFEFFTAGTANSAVYSAVLICAGLGAIINVTRYSLSRNRHGFVSIQSLVADTYEIQIPRDLKAQADDAIAKTS